MNPEQKLLAILNESKIFQIIFSLGEKIELPNWYIAGGCVTQTVWNYLSKYPLTHGLKDIDLVYFDPNETKPIEQKRAKEIKKLFSELTFPIDLINESKVHTWYEEKFGYKIKPYKSTEDGISTWLSAFSVGVRIEHGEYKVFSAFGLTDLFNMHARANKRQITKNIYEKMLQRLKKDWPKLTFSQW